MKDQYKQSRLDTIKEHFGELGKNFIANLTGRHKDEYVVDDTVHGRSVNKQMVLTLLNHGIVIFAAVFAALTAQCYQVYFVLKAAGYDFSNPDKHLATPPASVWMVYISVLIFFGVYLVAVSLLVCVWVACYLIFLRSLRHGKDIAMTGVSISGLLFVILGLISFIFKWHPHVFWVVWK